MMIEFSEEQAMLLETAMEFCSNQSPISRVRQQLDEAAGFDPAQWQQMVDLGWLGINIPEQYGGLGMNPGDVVPVVEAMGRSLMGSPYFACTLAATALVANGSEDQKSEWLPKLAAGTIITLALSEPDGAWSLSDISASGTVKGDRIELSGTKTFVLDAAQASLIIVSVLIEGTPALVAVEKSALDEAIQRETVIDETRRSYAVCLDGVSVASTNRLERCRLDTIEQYALLLLGAEIAGGMAGVLNVIIEYLNTRKQFDRLIGSYQALKHPTVDILVSTEAARSHIYHCATLMGTDRTEELNIALRMCKAHGSEAFAHAGDRAVQFHGGFGFTYECDAQLYLRRALWCQYQYGDQRYHREMLAPMLLGETA